MIIDLLFILAMLIAVFRGLSKGLILGVFSMIAYVIGIAAALKLSVVLAKYLEGSSVVSTKWLPVVSFIVVFIIVVLLVKLGAKLLEKTVKLVMLGWLNRLGGVVFYVALYTIIFSIFLFYAEHLTLLKESTIKNSQLYSYIAPIGPKVIDSFGKVIPMFKGMFSELENFFDGIAKKSS